MLFITLFIEAIVMELGYHLYWWEVEQTYAEMEDQHWDRLAQEAEDRWLCQYDYRPDYPY